MFAVVDLGGRFVGSATPDMRRDSTGNGSPGGRGRYLPLSGIARFDMSIVNVQSDRTVQDIVMHELGHALGFVPEIFVQLGLLTPSDCIAQVQNGVAPTGAAFTGDTAVSVLPQVDSTLATTFAKIEDMFNSTGATCSHWRQDTFKSEIMTSIVTYQGEFLSWLERFPVTLPLSR